MDDFDAMLDELVQAPVYRCGELPAPPKTAGVYVFAQDGVVFHVGRTGNLQERRRNQTGLTNDRHTATFAFRKAVEDARRQFPHLSSLTRGDLEAHPDFKPLFQTWKENVRGMDMRFIEIASASKRHLFEMMASMALGLPEELWDEH